MDASHVLPALLLAVLAAPARGVGDVVAFEEGLDETHRLMARAEWDAARARLTTLLDEHAGETYVLERFPTIREDLQRCAFWKGRERPEPKDVISGQLVSYGAASGKVKVRYGAGDLDDFTEPPFEKTPYRVHPLTFDGEYSVELTWSGPKPSGRKRPRLLTGYGSAAPVGVAIGADVVLTERVTGDEWWDLATFPLKSRVKLLRKKKEVRFFVDGKKVYTHKVPERELGRIALLHFDEVPEGTTILISGDGQPSWLESAVDGAVREAWAEFEESYALNDDLPAWLAEANAGDPEAFFTQYPGPRRDGQDELWEEGWAHVVRGEFRELLEFEDELDKDCSSVFRTFWDGWREFLKGDYEDAEACCKVVLESTPDHVGVRVLETYLRWSQDDREAALTALGELHLRQPTNVDVINLLVTALMWEGRIDEARSVPREALAAGVPIEALSTPLAMLGKAQRGPDWLEPNEFVSAHYRVVSDMNVKTCSDAAKQLEAALKFYGKELRPSPPDDNKYEVYLFSGRQGYLDYTQDLMGSASKGSLGLYTPALKQLLIWNVPDREEMMRTVRHEAFHQYLDRLLDVEAPRWLNEGLAEYFETATMVGRKAHTGEPHAQNLQALQGFGVPDLEEFLELSDAQFMAHPLSYPYSWGLVHFLLETGEEHRALFDEIIDRMLDGQPGREAVRSTFESVDLEQLEVEFGTHIRLL